MLKRIVVPVDGSGFAQLAVPAAAAIARASGATIALVAVATDDDELVSTAGHVDAARRLLPGGTTVEEEVVVGLDPAAALLQMATAPGTVLCLASHDHRPFVAFVRNSVGSHVIERAVRPFLVVGPNADSAALGRDVVVAVHGEFDPMPLLSTAACWALALDAPLRIVTVFEPALDDLGRPQPFGIRGGAASDPESYLHGMWSRLDGFGMRQVEVEAIPGANAANGLSEHLHERPALILALGRRHWDHHLLPGVTREVLRQVGLPVLVV